MYEYLDTRYGIKGSALAVRNLSFRVVVRGGYLAINTFVAALLPFLGDFMSLTGAVSTFPLTFILANHMYLVAKDHKLTSLQKSWHWLNVCFFGCMSLAAAVAALRLIALDSKTYHLFADLWSISFFFKCVSLDCTSIPMIVVHNWLSLGPLYKKLGSRSSWYLFMMVLGSWNWPTLRKRVIHKLW